MTFQVNYIGPDCDDWETVTFDTLAEAEVKANELRDAMFVVNIKRKERAANRLSTECTVLLDGGPSNPLPVTARGYWEEGRFVVEEVELVIAGKRYDLIENLSRSTIDHLTEQVSKFEGA